MKARVKGTDDPFRDIETVEMKGVVGIYFVDACVDMILLLKEKNLI